MATINLPTLGSNQVADTNATKNTIVLRDNQGNIFGATIQATDLTTTGYFTGAVSIQTASFTAGAATDYQCNATSGAITVTLPLASANTGVVYWFRKTDSSGNSVTLTGVLGTSTISSQYTAVRVISDGTSWFGH